MGLGNRRELTTGLHHLPRFTMIRQRLPRTDRKRHDPIKRRGPNELRFFRHHYATRNARTLFLTT